MSEAAISIANLVLYCAQQLGVTLGVGAETVLLVAYINSIRDGVVDEKEKGFSRAVRKVMDIALVLIIASGLGVIATQYLSGQGALFSVTFLFKWSLIGIVLVMSLANRGSSLTAGLLQGLSAGTWYALFAVHILAPEASWLSFLEFYGAWLIGFMVVWTSIVFSFKGKLVVPANSTQKRDLPQRGEFSAKNSPTYGAVAPAYVSGKSVSASTVIVTPDKAIPPVSRMPEQNFAAVRGNRSESFVQAPSMGKIIPTPPAVKVIPIPVPIPQPPKPPAVQSIPVPVPPAMPPSPPPPPPAPTKQPPSPGAPLGVLHVMPRTLEEVQQRTHALA